MPSSPTIQALKFIKKSAFVVWASVGLSVPAAANIQQWVTGNEQTNARLQVAIQDQRNSFSYNYQAALDRRIGFDLDNAKFFAHYNVNSPAEGRPANINACLSHLAASYGRGHTNIFFAPQWQYGIRKYSDNFYTWYDLPPSAPVPESLPESLCAYQFSPEIAEHIRTNYPYFHQDEIKIRARFGLVLSAIDQFPAGLFSNAYTPAINITPRPIGGFTITRPAKVNLADFSARYTIDDSNVFTYTGERRTEYIWGLVYQSPGGPLNYVASYPNYRYDSVNNREFIQPHGTQDTMTLGALYPQASTNYSFPNGVPAIPENAQAYLRVEVRKFPKHFGAVASTVFMLPHENTAPRLEYGYRGPAGQFKALGGCSVTFAECFPEDREVDFLIRITDPDLIHSVTGNYYLGSGSDANDRAPQNRGTFSAELYDRVNNPRGKTALTLTTGFNLATAYELINRTPDFFDKIYFDIRTRDYFGTVHNHRYGLELPVRHTGELRVGYSPAGNNQTDVFPDGSGLLTVDVSGVNFEGLTPYAYQWYLGTTAISGAVSASFYLRYNYVDYLEARQVPVKVKVAYTDGNIRYQVLEQTFNPVRLTLIDNAHQFFTGETNPVIKATVEGQPADWVFVNSELLRNIDGGGSFAALPARGQQSWPFTAAHWDDLYQEHGAFPPVTAWARRPAYKARFLMQQPDGFLVWMQSQVMEVPAPPVEAVRISLMLAPRSSTGPVTQADIVRATLTPGNLAAYLADSDINFLWQIAPTSDFTAVQNITVTNFNSLVELPLAALTLSGSQIRGVVRGRDRFGTNINLASNPLNLYTAPTGTIAIELAAPYLTNTSQLTVATQGYLAGNGGAFVGYSWEIIDALTVDAPFAGRAVVRPGAYRLTPNNLNMLRMGYVLKVEAVHQDLFANRLTLTAYTNYETLRENSNAPTEGAVVINGPAAFTAGAELFYIIASLADANGVGTWESQWYKKLAPNSDYSAIPGANDPGYVLNPEDFSATVPNYRPRVKVIVRHTDQVGNENAELLTDEIIYADSRPAPIVITASARIAGTTVSLVHPVVDANGLKTVTYEWQTGPANFSAWLVRSTLPEYTLTSADFNPHTHLRLVGVAADDFGSRVTLTSNILEIDSELTGNISLNIYGGVLATGAVVTVLTGEIEELNGGDFTRFAWSFAADRSLTVTGGVKTYTLSEADVTRLRGGATLHATGRYVDSLGFATTRTADLQAAEDVLINHPLAGSLVIQGNPSFGYETILTADVTGLTDPNGIANYDYQWSISYDAGTTFQPVRYATRPVFYHEIDDWNTDTLAQRRIPPIVRVAVIVMDNNGYASTVAAQIQHQDAPPAFNLTLRAEGYAPGAPVRVENFINDPNVVRPGTIRHRWQTAAREFTVPQEVSVHFSRNRADPTNVYTVRAPDFDQTREYLRLVTDYQDVFGARTEITSNIIKINQAPTGTLNAMIIGNTPEIGATVTVISDDVRDSNGGTIVNFSWHANNTQLATGGTVLIDRALAELFRQEVPLQVRAVYQDGLGINSTLTTTLDNTALNVVDYPTQGAARLTGPFAFAPGAQYSLNLANLADGNGRGLINYQWAVSWDSGANWQRLSVHMNENLTMRPEYFSAISRPHRPQLRAELTHYDQAGFVQEITSNVLTHENQNITGRLAINALRLDENGLVTVVTIPEDGDGIREINYQWQAGNDLFFGVAEAIGANQPSYRFAPLDFNPHAVIRVIAEITDHYDNVQKITSNHIPVASRTVGALQVTLTEALHVGAVLRPSTINLYDANGGQIVRYRWELNNRVLATANLLVEPYYRGYTLQALDVRELAAGHPLALVGVYEDDFFFRATVTAGLTLPGDSPSQVATLDIAGANSFAAGNSYTVHLENLTDQNGRGQLSYQWHQRAGTMSAYAPIAAATGAIYQLNTADFSTAGNNYLGVSVTHSDAAGYDFTWWVTLAHQDTPAEDSLIISTHARTPGSSVTIIRAPIDPNGIATITYQWQGVPANANSAGVDLPAATLGHYLLNTLEVYPYESIKLKALVEDVFGGRTTLYSNNEEINEAPRGLIWIETPATLTSGATLRVMADGLYDPNGGQLIDFTWRLDDTTVHQATVNSYVPSGGQTEKLLRGATLALVATHRDAFGFTAQFTASVQFNTNQESTVEIHGDSVFADGNQYTAVLTPAAPPPGVPAAAPARPLGFVQAATNPATIEYQWGYSEYIVTTAPDAGDNINLVTVESGFVPLVNQTNSIYIMTASIFQHGKKLMVMAMRIDERGMAFGSQGTKVIENVPSGGRIDLTIPGYHAGAVLQATGQFYDTNGITATVWRWESGRGPSFDNPVELQVNAHGSYTLNMAHFAPNDYVRVIGNIVDSLDQTTTITAPPQKINQPTQGQIILHASPPVQGIVTLRADLTRLTDPNGPLSIVSHAWITPQGTSRILISEYQVEARLASEVSYVAEVADAAGFVSTISTNYQNTDAIRQELAALLPVFALESARRVNGAIWDHLSQERTSEQSYHHLGIGGQTLAAWSEVSQLFNYNVNNLKIDAQNITGEFARKDSAWAVWGNRFGGEFSGTGDNWRHSGDHTGWLVGADKTHGAVRLGLSAGQDRLVANIAENASGGPRGKLTKKLNILMPYIEYRRNAQTYLRGAFGYGQGAVKYSNQNNEIAKAKLEWFMAGLNAAYRHTVNAHLDLKISGGANTARTRTGKVEFNNQQIKNSINSDFSYESYLALEKGYAHFFDDENSVRPFVNLQWRTNHGENRDWVIIDGGAGAEWTLPQYSSTGKISWQRQLTADNFKAGDSFTLSATKNIYKNSNLGLQAEYNAQNQWNRALTVEKEMRVYQSNSRHIIFINQEDKNYTLGTKWLIKFD